MSVLCAPASCDASGQLFVELRGADGKPAKLRCADGEAGWTGVRTCASLFFLYWCQWGHRGHGSGAGAAVLFRDAPERGCCARACRALLRPQRTTSAPPNSRHVTTPPTHTCTRARAHQPTGATLDLARLLPGVFARGTLTCPAARSMCPTLGCAGGCGGRGYCWAGRCACHLEYAGPGCGQSLVPQLPPAGNWRLPLR
jgi:hypothetical protein